MVEIIFTALEVFPRENFPIIMINVRRRYRRPVVYRVVSNIFNPVLSFLMYFYFIFFFREHGYIAAAAAIHTYLYNSNNNMNNNCF